MEELKKEFENKFDILLDGTIMERNMVGEVWDFFESKFNSLIDALDLREERNDVAFDTKLWWFMEYHNKYIREKQEIVKRFMGEK